MKSSEKQIDVYFEKGKQLFEEKSFERAIGQFEKAVELAKLEEDWECYVKASAEIAQCLDAEGKYYEAIEQGKKALRSAEQYLTEEHILTAQINSDMAFFYDTIKKLDVAIEHIQKSLTLFLAIKGEISREVAGCYTDMATYRQNKGEYEKSLEYKWKALAILKQLYGETHIEIADTYASISVVYSYLQKYQEVYEFAQKALTLCEQLGINNHTAKSTALLNLAVYYRIKGDDFQLLRVLKEALKIQKVLLNENHPGMGWCYSGIGFAYHLLGDYKQQMHYYKQALAIYERLGEGFERELAASHCGIGWCHGKQRNYTAAIESYQKAIHICPKPNEVDTDLGDFYSNLGTTFLELGDLDNALKYAQKGIEHWSNTMGVHHFRAAETWITLGQVYLARKEFTTAQEAFEKSLNSRLKTFGSKSTGLSISYIFLGKFYLKTNQYKKAIHHFHQAMCSLFPDFHEEDVYVAPPNSYYLSQKELLHTLSLKAEAFYELFKHSNEKAKNLKVAFDYYHYTQQHIHRMRQTYNQEGSKLTLSHDAYRVYNQAIQVALSYAKHINTNIGQAAAWSYADQSKGINLFDAMQHNQAKTGSEIPKDLLGKERELHVEMTYLQKTIATEKAKQKQTDQQRTQILQWEKQHFDYLQQHEALIAQLESDYPDYYQLKYSTQTASIEQVQQLLNEESLLISYFIGEEQLFIFEIGANDFEIHTVNKPDHFEELIADFTDSINHFSRKKYIQTGYELYQLLLAPVLEKSKNKTNPPTPSNTKQVITHKSRPSKLIIIPDGQLTALPFEALLTEAVPPTLKYPDLPYLLMDYEVSYHYSATLFCHTTKQKTKQKASPNSFIGFAPVYADSYNEKQKVAVPAYEAVRSVSIGGKEYSELIYSEKEVQNLVKLFENQNIEAQNILHGRASKAAFLQKMDSFNYIHIAAHHIVHEAKSELSGILFSPIPPPIEATTTQNSEDPVLTIGETYHLSLNADLVVLSCCESGIGQFTKGEGMIAMNRGFLYAGAKNVIYTLFKVYDKEASELVERIYSTILEGEGYASALRKAKLEVIREKRITPIHWAGYVLLGY